MTTTDKIGLGVELRLRHKCHQKDTSPQTEGECRCNRIYNKILDSSWFATRLFVTWLVRDHVGVQLKVSNDNIASLDICNWTRLTGQFPPRDAPAGDHHIDCFIN